ncbi:DUF2256 domain-containing protein [Deinococcus cavernae]|uniref:DUF2256 domain-containing protein n=1 Tax=Deinococcus cavernae TaxID=2320857 RepID=A0A418VA61_9DEIO|nr:DUF2256 domain-containing protein [Deinococcus cavernae]RJF73004.1 DUF2256 domain-containing protein [Deinococcus cavernae]
MSKEPKGFGQGRRPGERPTKICPVCGLSFTWRKKWARDWENVRYCSERCRTRAKEKAC